MEIPRPIPNLEVKHFIADNTAGSPGGNVGRCQLLSFLNSLAFYTFKVFDAKLFFSPFFTAITSYLFYFSFFISYSSFLFRFIFLLAISFTLLLQKLTIFGLHGLSSLIDTLCWVWVLFGF